jgi:tetratricopeptide (TPR) repeat protein
MYAGKIYTPTDDDSQKCFQGYLQDAQNRLQHDQQLPNEPKQIKPGEGVKIVENRVQVTGQIAVMSINGLLAKVIFDKNPTLEFYIEESFPLDWMYPHLSPNGPIMKINRQPLSELSDEIVRRDHDYWTRFFQEMIGDWLNYDTPVEKVATFAREKHGKHPKPGRNPQSDDAQKWASKLRSSIGGIYAWRAEKASSEAEKARMVREADFAFRQALAVCPYSPEAVFRYVNLLFAEKRFSDAIIVVEAAAKLEPDDNQFRNLLKVTKEYNAQQTPR